MQRLIGTKVLEQDSRHRFRLSIASAKRSAIYLATVETVATKLRNVELSSEGKDGPLNCVDF